jgi:hypothetical protein
MSPVRMAKLESAIRVALAFNEAFNRHDVAAMMRLISDDCVLETATPAPDGERYAGKESIAAYWERYFRESSAARRVIEETFGFGHRCVLRWRCEWIDRAGATRHGRGVDIFAEQNGAICQHLSYAKG